MTQAQLERAVARATGETVATIQQRGFMPMPLPSPPPKRLYRRRRRRKGRRFQPALLKLHPADLA